jgi:hypothetical protein
VPDGSGQRTGEGRVIHADMQLAVITPSRAHFLSSGTWDWYRSRVCRNSCPTGSMVNVVRAKME